MGADPTPGAQKPMSSRQGGFTLLEILVAITLLALVLGGTYAAVVQTRTSIERTEAAVEGTEVGHQTVALYSQLLESVFYAAKREDLAFEGRSRNRGAESLDRVRFVTAAGHLFPLPGPPADLLQCTLELREEPDRRRLLVLEVAPASVSDPRNPGQAFVLSTEISGLDLSFLTPDGWVEEFLPEVWSGLPEAVRVRVYRDGQLTASRILVPALASTHPARRAES